MRRLLVALVALSLLASGSVGTLACGAARRAPVLVAQGGLAAADTIGQLQATTKQLTDSKVVPPETALKAQEALLKANTAVGQLVPVLKAIDEAQKAGTPDATQLDQALQLLREISKNLLAAAGELPGGEATKAALALVQTASDIVLRVLEQISQLRERVGTPAVAGA